MATGQASKPNHLDPSELGTREYWDNYYQNDLDNVEDNEAGADEHDDEQGANQPLDLAELESWFDDVDAPAKTLAFLTADSFPLSPHYLASHSEHGDRQHRPTVLDLGTGNGSALFSLRLEGGYEGQMVGVDYSSRSVELARRLWQQCQPQVPASATPPGTITFETLDLIHDDATKEPWFPVSASPDVQGFDLVLDKGTFDAISLSSATVPDPATGLSRRICESYPAKVSRLVAPGGFLLVTSCNWTEEEVIRWFMGEHSDSTTSEEEGGHTVRLEVYDRVKYPVYEFGGQKGQGVASVCFRRSS